MYLGDTSDGTSDELVDEGEGLGLLRHDGRVDRGEIQRVMVCTSLQVKHNGGSDATNDGQVATADICGPTSLEQLPKRSPRVITSLFEHFPRVGCEFIQVFRLLFGVHTSVYPLLHGQRGVRQK